MKELDFNYDNSINPINESIQLDTFEPITMYGQIDRYIFDFTKPLDPRTINFNPGNFGGAAIKDSYGNFLQDEGETNVEATSSGYKVLWTSRNYTYWDEDWTLAGIGGNGVFTFKNYPSIYSAQDQQPSLPQLTYVSTPSSEQIFDENGNIDYITNLVPYINKDMAFSIDSSPTTQGIESFRSGYIEFTLKTDNQNCIIAFGENNGKISSPTVIDNDILVNNITGASANKLKIQIKNGKLNLFYQDLYTDNIIEITSNKTIADNNWHHIFINIGKKGISRTKSKRHNKSFIEFYINGQSDTLDYQINKKQIFFPLINLLFVDPSLTFKTDIRPELGYDISNRLIGLADGSNQIIDGLFVGNIEEENLLKAQFNPIADSVNFSGSMNTFNMGINSALSTEEIKYRATLYFSQKIFYDQAFNLTAEIVNPSVNTNKKKALKLYWNDIKNNKNGIELDNNFDVYSYSITHKNIISPSQSYNFDLAPNRKIKYIKDVRAVFIDNINIFGPGKVWNQSLTDLVNTNYPFGGVKDQYNLKDFSSLDSARYPNWWAAEGYKQIKEYSDYAFSDGALIDMAFSGIQLNNGDRILLTNQIRPEDNGIYIFNGYNNSLTIPEELSTAESLSDSVVRVIDGYFKDTSWILNNKISSISDKQEWVQLENHPDEENVNAQPILLSRWITNQNEIRMINLEEDVNINNFDIIVFMNYPEKNEEIRKYFIGYEDFEINNMYKDFIKSLKVVISNGANLYVSSSKLAEDLGIVKGFTEIDQEVENGDGRSADINPFQPGESVSRYFDTHRQNQYHLSTEIAGLTDKETYVLTDFINYIPEDQYDYDEYHAKYSYRQFGLQEGNEFIIPGSALRQITINENLPGFKANQLGSKPLIAVAPSDILAGTVIAKLANTHYHGSEIASNEYDDYVTTIIVHDGQMLGGIPINGKIFVNCVEDGYTFSREEYNKATIQIIPENDINESNATRAWQYSTTRLNRAPQRINIRGLTKNGQTTSTNGGGGPLIQAPSNSSNGIIRSEIDKGNVDYQSDLYPTQEEEIYPLQEIPVLSMTWLGLQWLVG